MVDLKKEPRVGEAEVPSYDEENALYTPARSRTDDWWLWEIAGIVISAAAICAIVGLLATVDGKRLPDWGIKTAEKRIGGKTIPSKTVNLSLNSVISWISTVGKICILIPITKGLGQLKWVWFAEQERQLTDFEKFDNATRGLSGSVMLLWRLRGRHFAVIGAIAVILALGFDPFIQNLVHYDTIYDVSSKDISTMEFAQTYDLDTTYGSTFGELDVFTKANINRAMYNVGNAFRVPGYSCSSGNCTWNEYATLAFEVRCAEISDKLTKTCLNTTTSDANLGPLCDWSLPNGFSMGSDGRTLYALNFSHTSITFSQYSDPLATIQVIENPSAEPINANIEASASECVLIPVVKAVNSSVGSWASNERFKRDESTHTFETEDNYMENNIDTYEKYTFVSAADNSPTAGYFLSPPAKSGITGLDGKTKYWVSNQATVSLQKYLKTFFQGFVRTNGTNADGTFVHTYRSELNGDGTSDAIQTIYEPSNAVVCNQLIDWGFSTATTSMPCVMENVAAGLTSMIRSMQGNAIRFADTSGNGGGEFPGLLVGQVIMPFPQVNVTWWWIILPLVIWCLSVTMLVGTALKTRRAGVHTWRTNPLAMVFLELGKDEKSGIKNHALTEEGLIKRAESLKVQLKLDNREAIMLKKAE